MSRVVLFLPGIIAPAAVRYQRLLERLPDVHALLKDLEVYRDETPPENYSIAAEIDAIEALAQRENVKTFDIVAHSGGAAIALAYVAAHPARVRSLAVDEPAFDFSPEAEAELREFHALGALPPEERMRAFMKLQVSPVVTITPPPTGDAPPWMAKRPAGALAFIDALGRHGRLRTTTTFRAPVLYTWGSLTHPRWNAMRDRLAAVFPGFTSVRFEGLHHLNTSHQAQPDAVAELLRALWARAS
jgi:pimeloyl-ACP methyl ester carboxylesterase